MHKKKSQRIYTRRHSAGLEFTKLAYTRLEDNLSSVLALPASQFVHKKKSQRICTRRHSAGLELTKLAYTRREDHRIRHRGDRLYLHITPPGTGGHHACNKGSTFL